MTTGTCQTCGATAPIEWFLSETKHRQLAPIMGKLPSNVGEAIICYLGLFRPVSGHAMQAKKALRLVTEIAEMVATGHIQVQGKVARPCSPHHWAAGMGQMTERRGGLSLPLKNHNYLRQIVWQLADSEDRRQETEARNKELTGESRNREPADGLSELTRKYMQQEQDEKDQK